MLEPFSLRRFGPKEATDPSCGQICGRCNQPMNAGCFTTVVAVGARSPMPKLAMEVHWDCAGKRDHPLGLAQLAYVDELRHPNS